MKGRSQFVLCNIIHIMENQKSEIYNYLEQSYLKLYYSLHFLSIAALPATNNIICKQMQQSTGMHKRTILKHGSSICLQKKNKFALTNSGMQAANSDCLNEQSYQMDTVHATGSLQ